MAKKKPVKELSFAEKYGYESKAVLRPLSGNIYHEKAISGPRVEFFKVFESNDDVNGPIMPGGCLAVPSEMDMYDITVTLADYTGDESTIMLLASKVKIQWILAGHTIWLSSKLSDGIYNSATQQFTFDITNPMDSKPHRFLSKELFSVVLENLMPELWRRIRVAINGTLYVPI